ncbi:MAG: hypothetical protein IT382_16975 [Deltaproteobacteria bacterium]|nr:hypothetical protein [Deltaproteobacteria bacterium]
MKVTSEDIKRRMEQTGEPYRTASRALERARRAARGEVDAVAREQSLVAKTANDGQETP